MSVTLKDSKVSQIIKRHFIAFAVEADKAPPALKSLLSRAGDTFPQIVYVTDKGALIHSSSGARDVEQVVADLEKVLEDKRIIANKQSEGDFTKHLSTLEKAMENKEYKKVTSAWNALNKVKGYSTTRDKAYELMDKATEDGVKKQKEAVEEAKKDEYSKAKELLNAVVKEFAGLPIAEDAKDDLEALKLLEAAAQMMKDQKPAAWKNQAAMKLTQVYQKYPDSPLSAVAFKRFQDLAKS